MVIATTQKRSNMKRDIEKINDLRKWMIGRMAQLSVNSDNSYTWVTLAEYNEAIAELMHDYLRFIEEELMNDITNEVFSRVPTLKKNQVDCIVTIRLYASLNGFSLPDGWPCDVETMLKARHPDN